MRLGNVEKLLLGQGNGTRNGRLLVKVGQPLDRFTVAAMGNLNDVDYKVLRNKYVSLIDWIRTAMVENNLTVGKVSYANNVISLIQING